MVVQQIQCNESAIFEGKGEIMNKEKIKEIRLTAGKTQKEFAAALFVSERSVRNWEKGTNKPNSRSIMDMEKIEGISEEIRTTFFDALKTGIEAGMQLSIAAAKSLNDGIDNVGGIVPGTSLPGDIVTVKDVDKMITLTREQIDNLLNGSWKEEPKNETQ